MVIETESLTKYYGNKIGCKDISISVGEGEIFGFLGPNGAGKSTFIKMMVGLLFPTSGKAFVLGRPVGDIDVRKKIGYLPENFKYQDWMTGEDLLNFHASLYKLDKKSAASKIEEVLDIVKLKGHESYRVGTYSKGMQQRIGLACALLTDPDLLFLDEPTSALDPVGRKEVREIMTTLKSKGKTVLLNSHLLSEVEAVCDSAAIIKRGSIIKYGKMDDILESKLILEIQAENLSNEILSKLKEFDSSLTQSNNKLNMQIKSKTDIHCIASIIVNGGGRLFELSPKKVSLENVFLNLIEGGEQR
ncbi:ABC transporter ATP-binding protein [Clostridium intestinale]|uniref:ABC-2 type transport system ATP-binding protein n=1 Tax=Clostridium intestinale DSM 6191 TaxID=1121320 RepID=A0A1M6B8V8_9CLOT|nr:ABC transporter ATP-binding protein [Clostridium intestinale]SHI45152.1 ABC-2 type transport system ATP-binding protein [Clostridium intestinale DSM 6191]